MVDHLVVKVSEPHEETLLRHAQLVLNHLEVVRLLADVVAGIDWVEDRQAVLPTRCEVGQPVVFGTCFNELAVLVNADVLGLEVLAVDCKEVVESASEVLREDLWIVLLLEQRNGLAHVFE